MGNDSEKWEKISSVEARVSRAARVVKLAEGALASARLELDAASKSAKTTFESEILSLAGGCSTVEQTDQLTGLFRAYMLNDYFFGDQVDQEKILNLSGSFVPGEPILVTREEGFLLGNIAQPDAEDDIVAVPIVDRPYDDSPLRLRWAVALEDGGTIVADETTVIGEKAVGRGLVDYVTKLRENRHGWMRSVGGTLKALSAFGREDTAMEYTQLAMSDARALVRAGGYDDVRDAFNGIRSIGDEELYVRIFSEVVSEIKYDADSDLGGNRCVKLARALASHIVEANNMKRSGDIIDVQRFVLKADTVAYRLVAELQDAAKVNDIADIARIVEATRGFLGADAAEAADAQRLF
jgi:hypothetical protein